jgi:hypothetical protein
MVWPAESHSRYSVSHGTQRLHWVAGSSSSKHPPRRVPAFAFPSPSSQPFPTLQRAVGGRACARCSRQTKGMQRVSLALHWVVPLVLACLLAVVAANGVRETAFNGTVKGNARAAQACKAVTIIGAGVAGLRTFLVGGGRAPGPLPRSLTHGFEEVWWLTLTCTLPPPTTLCLTPSTHLLGCMLCFKHLYPQRQGNASGPPAFA